MTDDTKIPDGSSAKTEFIEIENWAGEDHGDPDPETYTGDPDAAAGGEMSATHHYTAVIYMLHGWDLGKNYSPGRAFRPAADYVRSALRNHNVLILDPPFNTHESHFRAGENLSRQHKRMSYPTNNVHFFGYSMGGLVARQMVAQGIVPRSLTTYCTPNEGTGWWVPNGIPFNNGSSSMFENHNDLTVLNSRPSEIQYRNRYTTYGFWYKGGFNSTHDNDGMIEERSANMRGLSVGPRRAFKCKHSAEGWFTPIASPHGELQNMEHIRPALERFIREDVAPTL